MKKKVRERRKEERVRNKPYTVQSAWERWLLPCLAACGPGQRQPFSSLVASRPPASLENKATEHTYPCETEKEREMGRRIEKQTLMKISCPPAKTSDYKTV
ncbi:hypothetical protein AAFF_G00361100 [Aldrovandia affinis]|uniref:Uncharacterized protein n=1 Tax=Aldrovandia affinis TaxID=143900 RepID=A0AAD7R5C1_9TELE|nr:hypothetical protein AAFF_G00361100 [Aldrovandia affinis]